MNGINASPMPDIPAFIGPLHSRSSVKLLARSMKAPNKDGIENGPIIYHEVPRGLSPIEAKDQTPHSSSGQGYAVSVPWVHEQVERAPLDHVDELMNIGG